MGEYDIPPGPPDFGKMFSPKTVDYMLRQSVMSCWMMLPPNKRNAPNLRAEMRRIVERALKGQREDAEAFGISGPG
jgi:hypothetical protein